MRQNLRSLSLEKTNVTDENLEHLALLPNLRWLSISEGDITDEGVAKIAKCRLLHTIRLSDTRITDESMEHLAQLRDLRWLDVSDNQLTDKALIPLATIQWFDRHRLKVSGTAITKDEIDKFRLGFPKTSKWIYDVDHGFIPADRQAP